MASPSTGVFVASAGLDLVAGVFGYLSSLEASSAARSRADMIRMSAEVNAQRYAEQATAQNAQRKMNYLASGVTLAGSPIDVLDTQARVAQENINAIRMGGATDALDEEQRGANAESVGRNALLGGIISATRTAGKAAYMNSLPKSDGASTGFDKNSATMAAYLFGAP